MKRSILGFLSSLLLIGCSPSVRIASVKITPMQAQQVVTGQDTLALNLEKFDAEKASKFFNRGAPLGVLDNTFSANVSHSRRSLTLLAPNYFRVHLINGPCIRNGNCGRYEIGYGYNKTTFNAALEKRAPKILKYLRERTAVWRQVASESPSTTFILSPGLEHDWTQAAFTVAADTVLGVYPGVQLDNSPDGGAYAGRYAGAWVERHGTNFQPDADIVSMDGAEGTDISINAFNKRVQASPRLKIAYTWSRVYNCRDQNPKWTDPRARKSCPGASQFELLAHLTDQRPAAPKFTGKQCTNKPFVSPQIWKPFAEDSGNGDPRANTPVALVKPKGGILYVLDYTGHRVGTLGLYSSYPGNLDRYYSNYKGGSTWGGYGFEKAATAQSGNPAVWLQAGGSCEGPIITGQRQGSYK